MIFRLKAIPDIIQQVYFIGAKSAQIVMLVGFFTGMVLGLQLYFVLVKFGSVGVLGTAIASIKTEGLIGDKYVAIDPGGGGDLLANGDTITDTNSPTDIMDLISKYAFGDVK